MLRLTDSEIYFKLEKAGLLTRLSSSCSFGVPLHSLPSAGYQLEHSMSSASGQKGSQPQLAIFLSIQAFLSVYWRLNGITLFVHLPVIFLFVCIYIALMQVQGDSYCC